MRVNISIRHISTVHVADIVWLRQWSVTIEVRCNSLKHCCWCQGRRNRGVRGSNDPQKFTWGSNMVFWPPRFYLCWYESTSLLYYILKLGLGMWFLLSFITDLWTPWNVALMILTPQSNIVPARLFKIDKHVHRDSTDMTPRNIFEKRV